MTSYSWVAIYNDGGTLYQYDPNTGVESSSDHIDRTRLTQVHFFGPQGLCAVVHVDPGSVFFYRRRVEMTSNMLTGNQIGTGVVHLMGCWRKTADPHNPIQHALMVPEVQYGVPIVQLFGQPVSDGHRYEVVPVQVELDALAAAPILN